MKKQNTLVNLTSYSAMFFGYMSNVGVEENINKNKPALPQHYAIRAADQTHVCTVDCATDP